MDEKKVMDAIDGLKDIMQSYKNMISENEDCKLLCIKLREKIEHLNTAIEALEKQLPKKPKENGMYSGIFKKTKTYTCLTCGNCCLEKMMNERQDTDFCWNCGQKLDWSE